MLQGQNMLTWTEGETCFNPDLSRLMAPFQKRSAFVRGKGYPEPWLLFVLIRPPLDPGSSWLE